MRSRSSWSKWRAFRGDVVTFEPFSGSYRVGGVGVDVMGRGPSIAVDIWGPLNVPSPHGLRYCLLAFDHHTNYMCVRFLKSKDDTCSEPESIVLEFRHLHARYPSSSGAFAHILKVRLGHGFRGSCDQPNVCWALVCWCAIFNPVRPPHTRHGSGSSLPLQPPSTSNSVNLTSTPLLYAPIKDDVYIHQPLGFKDGTPKVCVLKRCLCGLKSTPREFNTLMCDWLVDNG
jgi:hypothetical protein